METSESSEVLTPAMCPLLLLEVGSLGWVVGGRCSWLGGLECREHPGQGSQTLLGPREPCWKTVFSPPLLRGPLGGSFGWSVGGMPGFRAVCAVV